MSLSGLCSPLRIAAVCVMLLCSLARADADIDLRAALYQEMYQAWVAEDFGKLEAMAKDYMDLSRRTPSGKQYLALFEVGLNGLISIRDVPVSPLRGPGARRPEREREMGPEPVVYPAVYDEWGAVEKKLGRWSRQYPDSDVAVLMWAIFYMERGYYFRGTRYSKDVRPEAWAPFRQGFSVARRILEQSRKVENGNPMWFSTMATNLQMQSASDEEWQVLVDDVLAHAGGYSEAYVRILYSMQPKWGGSYAAMERFARMANERTMSTEHGGMYARLYWNLYENEFKTEKTMDFLQRARISWPLLSRSFDAINERYPAPRGYTGHAMFACLAGDVGRAKQLLEKAGSLEYTVNWLPALKARCL